MKSETAKCTECTKLLSLGSDKPGKQTVHGLKCTREMSPAWRKRRETVFFCYI